MTSKYPDGSTNPNWSRARVVIPQKTRSGVIKPANAEEYLVRWCGPGPFHRRFAAPHSWHSLQELSLCLLKVQVYIENIRLKPRFRNFNPLKRKTLPDFGEDERNSRRPSVISISSSDGSTAPSRAEESSKYSYHGTTKRIGDEIVIVQDKTTYLGEFASELPTAQMIESASRCETRQAAYEIRTEYNRRLARIPGPPVSIRNLIDESTPTLDFEFVSDLVIGEDIEVSEEDAIVGCGSPDDPSGCRPNMGQYMGCEYGRKCGCLEFAAIDDSRMTDEDEAKLAQNERLGLPKRFPYFNPNSRRPKCLVGFYLASRHPIYECNLRCNCGPDCRTRLVQKGRQILLEVFKTEDRGWGLRTLEDLQEGQFIDTYRGEVITTSEADRRMEDAAKGKASYQYALDKHVGEQGLEEDDCYVVDGEFMGGPSRWMNHSCEPNCRQYTVSYNKYDFRIYQLAFFACRAITKGTELTFDYLDKDFEEDEEADNTQSQAEEGKDPMICRCGSQQCRKKLWI